MKLSAWVNFGLTEQRRRSIMSPAQVLPAQQKALGFLLLHDCPWYWAATRCWGTWWGTRSSWPYTSFTQALDYAKRTSSETTFSCIDTVCDNSGLKLCITLHTLMIQQPILKPVIRLYSKGREVVLQVKKVVLCLLPKAFSRRSCSWTSNQSCSHLHCSGLVPAGHNSCVILLGQGCTGHHFSDTEALTVGFGFRFKDLNIVLVLPKLPLGSVV